jgi:hypothetical protein
MQYSTLIEPKKEYPFVHEKDPASYYCNICQKYSPDFHPSAIKSNDRRCRPCKTRVQNERNRAMKGIDRLLAKLRINLRYHKANGIAKAVNRDHVVDILKNSGVDTCGTLDFVKTISPNYDPLQKMWRYNVVFNYS